ncbi:hypothetical protein [Streptococcus sp. HF-2466]|nr:hypothetical protein [Streptococcus sp. HF-2466]
MEYINKKTGVIIDVDSQLSGNWEPVEDAKKPAKKAKASEE